MRSIALHQCEAAELSSYFEKSSRFENFAGGEVAKLGLEAVHTPKACDDAIGINLGFVCRPDPAVRMTEAEEHLFLILRRAVCAVERRVRAGDELVKGDDVVGGERDIHGVNHTRKKKARQA